MLKLKRIFLLYIITSLCLSIAAIAQNAPAAGAPAREAGAGAAAATQRPNKSARLAYITDIEKQIANLRTAIQKAQPTDPCIATLTGDNLTSFSAQYNEESSVITQIVMTLNLIRPPAGVAGGRGGRGGGATGGLTTEVITELTKLAQSENATKVAARLNVLAKEVAATQAAARGGRGGGSVRSPEILQDNKITFRISAPQATSVSVNGDWGGNAATAMTKDANGLWSITVGPLASELYGYTFSIDAARVWDPVNNQLKRDGTNITSVLITPGDKGDMYSIKDVPHGTVAKVWYDSPTLNLKRRMYVYTPPGYETSDEKYPVFYLLHGTGGDEDAWTSMGRAPQILDNLIAAGKARPMIVVMTNGNAWQTAAPDALPAGASGAATDQSLTNSPLFPQSLVKDVIPFIEKSYRVIAGKDNRAIAGLSMGGGHTIMATNGNPGVFGYVGVFSSGPREGYRVTYDDNFKKQLSALKESVIFYYVGCGVNDTTAKSGADNLANTLKEYGFNYKYSETPGGHTWSNWRIYLTEFHWLIPTDPFLDLLCVSVLGFKSVFYGLTKVDPLQDRTS